VTGIPTATASNFGTNGLSPVVQVEPALAPLPFAILASFPVSPMVRHHGTLPDGCEFDSKRARCLRLAFWGSPLVHAKA